MRQHADRVFRAATLVVFLALCLVQAIGADALFGSLLARGFVPRSPTPAGIAAPILNVVHLAVYLAVAVAFCFLIVRGRRAWLAGLVVAIPAALQAITDGCPLTPVQNALWATDGVSPIDNRFIFDAFVPLPSALSRAAVLALAALYASPAVGRLARFSRIRSRTSRQQARSSGAIPA
ncbi:MAG: hypothetical protein U0556_05920 [Dehalococcoidia bacterium]